MTIKFIDIVAVFFGVGIFFGIFWLIGIACVLAGGDAAACGL